MCSARSTRVTPNGKAWCPPRSPARSSRGACSAINRGTLMKLLHTMGRVGDLPRGIDFYTNILGMTVLRTVDVPAHQYRLAFVGYGAGNADGSAEIEITYNYGVAAYDQGTAFGHFAIGVKDVAATCQRIRAAGGKVTREAGPVKGGTTVIAFVQDPDGYKIELIERPALD